MRANGANEGRDGGRWWAEEEMRSGRRWRLPRISIGDAAILARLWLGILFRAGAGLSFCLLSIESRPIFACRCLDVVSEWPLPSVPRLRSKLRELVAALSLLALCVRTSLASCPKAHGLRRPTSPRQPSQLSPAAAQPLTSHSSPLPFRPELAPLLPSTSQVPCIHICPLPRFPEPRPSLLVLPKVTTHPRQRSRRHIRISIPSSITWPIVLYSQLHSRQMRERRSSEGLGAMAQAAPASIHACLILAPRLATLSTVFPVLSFGISSWRARAAGWPAHVAVLSTSSAHVALRSAVCSTQVTANTTFAARV